MLATMHRVQATPLFGRGCRSPRPTDVHPTETLERVPIVAARLPGPLAYQTTALLSRF
jgi:hypothetical protein